MSGSVYSIQGDFFASTGTVYIPQRIIGYERPSMERLMICPNCKTHYILNLGNQKGLIRLSCESCGGSLEFTE